MFTYSQHVIFTIFSLAQEFSSGLDHSIAEIFNSNTIRDTSSKTPLNEWPAGSRTRYIHNT